MVLPGVMRVQSFLRISMTESRSLERWFRTLFTTLMEEIVRYIKGTFLVTYNGSKCVTVRINYG